MWLTSVAILCIITIIYHFWTKRDLYRLSWQMPGPFMIPMVGSLCSVLALSSEGAFKVSQYLTSNFKSPTKFWLGPTFYVYVREPEDMKIILNSPQCLSRFDLVKVLPNLAVKGLLNLPGPEWKVRRKLINPKFSFKNLQSYMPIFNEQVNVLISCLEELDGKNATDMYTYMSALTLDAVCATNLGSEMNIQKKHNIDYFHYFNRLFTIITKRISNPFFNINWIYNLTLLKEETKAIEITSRFVNSIYETKKESFILRNNNGKDKISTTTSSGPLLDHLINLAINEMKLTDNEVLNEINGIMNAAFESTAVTSSYCILAMAMFPQHQNRIYEEIRGLLPNRNVDVQYDDLNKFGFLNRFIQECLRLFTPVPVILRTASETFNLGTHVLCDITHLHRDKNAWGPTAEEFDPDRFLPENFKHIPPYAYLPFGGGPRNCIGLKYAQIFLTIILVKLVSNFTFETNLKMEDLRFRVEITNKLINKHMVYVKKRD